MRAHGRRDRGAWPTRRGGTASRRSPPSAPPGCGIAANARRRSCGACASAARRRGRGDLRRGGGPAGLPRGRLAGLGRRRRLARRLRHRRRQLAVHVRPRRATSTSSSASTSARCASPSSFGLDGAVVGGDARRGARRDRRRARAPRRPTRARRARRHGRRGHEPRRRQARAARRTTPTSSRAPSSTAPRSTGRSSSTARATPTQRREIVGLQPEPGRGHPRRRLHRAHRARQARPRLAHVSDRGLRHGVLAERFGAVDRRRIGRRRPAR